MHIAGAVTLPAVGETMWAGSVVFQKKNFPLMGVMSLYSQTR
jgi:hypothetical protein